MRPNFRREADQAFDICPFGKDRDTVGLRKRLDGFGTEGKWKAKQRNKKKAHGYPLRHHCEYLPLHLFQKQEAPVGGASVMSRDGVDQPFFRQRFPSVSAICTAFRAAPLRRLSLTHQRFRPFSMVPSCRMRLT